MGPNQMPPPSGNFNPQQYDFITNPAKPNKPSILPIPGGNGNKKQRILFFVLGGLVLITLLILIAALVFGNSNSNTDQLLGIGKQQTELIRIASVGEQKATGETAKSLAINTKLTITSQQTALSNYLKSNGKKKLSAKDLTGAENSDANTQLANAETNGRFDDVFIDVMNEALADYQASLKNTYSTVSGNTAKQLLSTDYEQVSILLGQND